MRILARRFRLLPVALIAAACTAAACGGGGGGHRKSGGPSTVQVVIGARNTGAGAAELAVTSSSGDVVSTQTIPVALGSTAATDVTVPHDGGISVYWTPDATRPSIVQAIHVVDAAASARIVLPITFFETPTPPSEITRATITVAPAPPGTVATNFYMPCSSGGFVGTAVTAQVAICDGRPTFDLYAVAFDSVGPAAWGAALGLPASPGNTVAAVVHATNATFVHATTKVSGLPPGVSYASVYLQGSTSNGMLLGGAPPAPFTAGSTTASSNVFIAPATTDLWVEELANVVWTDQSSLYVDRVRPGLPGASEYDFATLNSLATSTTPLADAADPTRPIFDWAISASGDRPDLTTVEIRWLTSSNTGAVTQTIWLPPDQTSARLPAIPSDQSTFVPSPATLAISNVTLALADRDDVDGYANLLSVGVVRNEYGAASTLRQRYTSGVVNAP